MSHPGPQTPNPKPQTLSQDGQGVVKSSLLRAKLLEFEECLLESVFPMAGEVCRLNPKP